MPPMANSYQIYSKYMFIHLTPNQMNTIVTTYCGGMTSVELDSKAFAEALLYILKSNA